MSLSVVHVSWHLGVGGGELFLRDLASSLAGRDVEQHVFAVGPGGLVAGDLQAAGVPVAAFGKRTKLGLLTIRRLSAAMRRIRPDVVHTHGEGGLFWGLPAARLAGLPAVSLVYQNHRGSWVKGQAARRLLRWPRRVIAGSRDVERFMIHELAVPPGRITTIPCGILPRTFAVDRAPASDGGPVLLTVGRLVPEKGHRVLVAAFARIRARHPGARLRIVGDGPRRAGIEQAAREAGVADAVELPGTIYPTGDALRSADLFVFPSLVEPQGLALLEAFAAGVPVVASRTGGIPEMLEDGVDGLLAAPGDAADLARAIARMLASPALRSACVAHARTRLEAFDVATIADRYESLYGAVAGRAAPVRQAAMLARPHPTETR